MPQLVLCHESRKTYISHESNQIIFCNIIKCMVLYRYSRMQLRYQRQFPYILLLPTTYSCSCLYMFTLCVKWILWMTFNFTVRSTCWSTTTLLSSYTRDPQIKICIHCCQNHNKHALSVIDYNTKVSATFLLWYERESAHSTAQCFATADIDSLWQLCNNWQELSFS